MEKPYEVLFFLENESVAIVEIKRTDLPESATPDMKYHWVRCTKSNHLVDLFTFWKMNATDELQERWFEQGELKFSPLSGYFEDSAGRISLQNHTGNLPPEEVLCPICNALDIFYNK
ncbi:hypothetical protein [uncultured Bacteroides sp.]|uniref:hypothetical protein n=1 Tax=uncultured Bacteroides sp. TaxID=162156 RepID=UPI002AA95F42|nr:hypothetical protein [uncultured Bacteroides sp.]